MSQSEDAWSSIPGWEGYYEASTGGHIRSVDRRICRVLDGANLLPSALRQGKRGCLACSRAFARIRYHPELDMLTVSNSYYEKIMKT